MEETKITDYQAHSMPALGFSVSSKEICEAEDYKGELRCPVGLPREEATYCTSLWS